MTIFRVSKSDAAKVVKKLEDKEMTKLVHLWAEAMDSYTTMMAKHGDQTIKEARKLYSASDKKLKELQKDKKGNKEKIQHCLELRKWAYDTTVHIKNNQY